LRSTLRKNLFSRWLRKLGDNYLDARRNITNQRDVIDDSGMLNKMVQLQSAIYCSAM
jgi:hypothetical protein